MAKIKGSAIALLFGLMVPQIGLSSSILTTATDKNSDYATPPSLIATESIRPRVILQLDNSGSMLERAYSGAKYDPARKYYGYFSDSSCYKYDRAGDYFNFSSRLEGYNKGFCQSDDEWHGNFLNWIAMRRIDIIRQVMIGGRVLVVDSSGGEYYRIDKDKIADIGFYLLAGQEVTIQDGNWYQGAVLAEKDSFLFYNESAKYSPIIANYAFAICHGKIVTIDSNIEDLVNDSGTIKNTEVDSLKRNCESGAINSNSYAIRVRQSEEPVGILQEYDKHFLFGASVYNYDHRVSPDIDANSGNLNNTIYNANKESQGSNLHGGTMRPCFPDIRKPSNKRTNYDTCYDLYAGAPTAHIVDTLENYPLVWGSTPIAETLFEIGGYIKQQDYGGEAASLLNWYKNGIDASKGKDSKGDSYLLGNKNGAQAEWDPYYDQTAGRPLKCARLFVVNLNDGAPYADFDEPSTAHPIAYLPASSESLGTLYSGDKEMVDAVTLSLRGDCRDDLAGHQQVYSYFIFANLSESGLTGDNSRRIKQAAALGIADMAVLDADAGTVQPEEKIPDFDPVKSFACERSSWDQNADCKPDNYLPASDGETLTQRLLQVFSDIRTRALSSSSATIAKVDGSGGGAIYQALYRARVHDTDNERSVNWVGELQALFLDSQGQFRDDDGNIDGALDAGDNIVTFYYDDQAGRVRVKIGGAEGDIEDIQPIWSAAENLSSIDRPEVQRGYSSVAKNQRYIVTAKSFASNNSEVLIKGAVTTSSQDKGTQSFIESSSSLLGGWLGVSDKDVPLVINYIRGKEVSGYRNRTIGDKTYLLGDIVNSSPKVVGPPQDTTGLQFGDTSYEVFINHYKNRRQVVYIGGNDGMVHAFNGGFWYPEKQAFLTSDGNGAAAHALGAELWAYVPVNLLPHLRWLTQPGYQHMFYIDGDPQAFDVRIFSDDATHPGGWGTILVIGMRMGGDPVQIALSDNSTAIARSAFIIFDITDPEQPPRLLGEISDPGLGFTTGKPALVRRHLPGYSSTGSVNWSNPSKSEWYLLFGNGPADKQATAAAGRPTLYQLNLKSMNLKAFMP